MAGRLLSAVAGWAAARPRLVLAVALVLAALGAALSAGLVPSAATSTFVGSSSAEYRATQSFYAHFGEEPVEVLVEGSLQQLLLSSDLERLLGLEGCLAGRAPVAALAAEGGRAGPCGRLAALHAVKVVIGPGTFINEAAEKLDQQLAAGAGAARSEASAARARAYRLALAGGDSQAVAAAAGRQAASAAIAAWEAEVALLAARYGITSLPAVNQPEFVDALVFDSAAPAGTPKRRFAYLFPSPNAALVSVRLRAGLPEGTRNTAISLIGQAVAMPRWRLQHGERYLVTGEPAIVAGLSGALVHSVELLLVAVLIVMAATLSLIFRGRPRLLPLGIALLAGALTFGALAVAGGSLTVGSLAVLPVLVGLAVDYAVQLHVRAEEALEERAGEDVCGALRSAAARGGPTIAGAALASAAAMLGLLLSPIPLVRGFGVLLIAGIAIAVLCALAAGSAALALLWRPDAALRPRRSVPAGVGSVAGPLVASWRGAGELVREGPLPALVYRAAMGGARRRPRAVLAVALALAALGWGLATQISVQSDIAKLVPQSLPALRSLRVLERETGVGGQIDLLVSGSRLDRPAVIEWMSAYEGAVLKRFGYGGGAGGGLAAGSATGASCARAQLCPALSLPELFQAGATGTGESQPGRQSAPGRSGSAGAAPSAAAPSGAGASGGRPKLSQQEVRALLAAIPPYFTESVITPDRRFATLAFGIRLMPLERQQRVIEAMRSMLRPPPGVRAQLVGLAVLAARAEGQVGSVGARALTLLISLVLATAVLLALFRGDWRRTLAAALPAVLASGWSGLVLFCTRVPLNPMSVTLSLLVVAIATELSVLLAERYRQERRAGREPFAALERTYAATGAAVATSAVTAILGFAVLALSQIRMLQDFGLVTIIDLAVSLVGVLLVLPSTVLLVGGGGLAHDAQLPGRPLADSSSPGARRNALARLLDRARGATARLPA